MAEIQKYSFGSIDIDSVMYSSDVIIYSDSRIECPWRRSESHYLTAEDIPEIISNVPEVIVIGTGAVGIMQVDDNILSLLRQRGVEVYVEKTKQATKIYNDLAKNKKTCACLHLTC